MQSIQNAAQSLFLSVAEYFTPVLTSSHFYEKGVLTPEEFVAAGDRLTSQCKTWQWAGGEKHLAKPYLPPDKQFLITRNVPSMRRANTYSLAEAREIVVESEGDGEGWALTHADGGPSDTSGAVDLDTPASFDGSCRGNPRGEEKERGGNGGGEKGSEEDVPDLESYIDDNLLEEADVGALRLEERRRGDGEAEAAGDGKVLRVEEPDDTIVKW